MSTRFRVPQYLPKPPTTTSKSIRFPIVMADTIEQEIRGKNCSFSAFVIEAVRLALLDLEEQKTDGGNPA